ncbi:MAG TPA: sugar phosphate nucleotidyltransferase [Bacteroidota bacterium]|nr:sugar phosphate nucleotidyltransferase [Bacteroidota bacterium]
MKVVIFCGGMGTRLREYSEHIPKPLVNIGYRPILWHVMKYYAHYGHKDFILCLGYKADMIKNYFLNYNEYVSNDFVFSRGGQDIQLLKSDIDDWRITFVDTGLKSNIGERLRKVEHYLDGEEIFMANYSDGLTDMPLPEMIKSFKESGKIASMICPVPSQSFHVVHIAEGSRVTNIQYVRDAGIVVNGGFFIFRKEIFKYMRPGEELVIDPFRRLIAENQLMGYRYDNYWAMDTFKEQQELSDMDSLGNAPWEVWKHNGNHTAVHSTEHL